MLTMVSRIWVKACMEFPQTQLNNLVYSKMEQKDAELLIWNE